MKDPVSNYRVCIIGAGPSGTAMLRAFQAAEEKGATIPRRIVCYEKQEKMGGLWNYTWRTGLDEYGEPVHGSMYRHLWSNGPKECLEFADYTFEEHFKKPIPSFPPREVLHDYIMGRVKRSGVEKYVKCRHIVRNCCWDAEREVFSVHVCNLRTGEHTTEEFDWVVCASGHFSTPNVPHFAGLETFPGRVMHAHDFRSAEEMSGKDILIIGTSYSAEDISSQCYKYGVRSVTLSWRTAPMTFHWPPNFKTVPLLTHVEGRTCHFLDGHTADIDVIIFCTGYLHYFPFLDPDIRLKTSNRLWPDSLYKGTIFIPNPRMIYIGMQDQWFTFNMFDVCAWYARDVILGRISLPSPDEMMREYNEWREREEALGSDWKSQCYFQGDLVKHLLQLTDYNNFDVDLVLERFGEWEENKHKDIMTFRDQSHRSVMTGAMAPPHHETWLKCMDDSLEGYVHGVKRNTSLRHSP